MTITSYGEPGYDEPVPCEVRGCINGAEAVWRIRRRFGPGARQPLQLALCSQHEDAYRRSNVTLSITEALSDDEHRQMVQDRRL
jgi:hypothetical protein